MIHHRKPPLPETYTTWRISEHKGLCKFCCGPLPQKGDKGYHHARLWHPDCTRRFIFLTGPGAQRSTVYARDKGVCACCGRDTNQDAVTTEKPDYFKDGSDAFYAWQKRFFTPLWSLDHIRPLWKSKGLPDEERLAFFELDNMQTLCPSCHAAKTRREASERAKLIKDVA